jgi:hypothetical protein
MWLVPVVHDAVGWGWALALLAPGPLLAAIAMGRLERSPRAEVRTLHRRPIPVPVCVAC